MALHGQENRHVALCDNVTPPIQAGEKFRAVAMLSAQPSDNQEAQKMLLDQIAVIKKEDGYKGVYTGAVGYCVAVSVVERGANGEISRILMAHFPGGINDECFDLLRKKLNQARFRDDLELIVSSGLGQGNRQYNFDDLIDRNKVGFSEVRTTASSSSCVSFDGYAGSFGYDSETYTGKKEFIVGDINPNQERVMFQAVIDSVREKGKPDSFQVAEELKKISYLIDTSPCDDVTKAKLFKESRELFVKIKNDPENKQKIFSEYKKTVESLPLVTKFIGTLCVIFSVVLGVGAMYYGAKKNQRAQLAGLIEQSLLEPGESSPNKSGRRP